MKKYSLIVCLFFVYKNTFPQIQNIRDNKELTNFQNNLQTNSALAVVWGHFGYFIKYPAIVDTSYCKYLDKKVYAKITSAIVIKLFADSTTIYLPIKEPIKMLVSYKEGDLIKLKIRVYKNCKNENGRVFFLMEDIL